MGRIPTPKAQLQELTVLRVCLAYTLDREPSNLLFSNVSRLPTSPDSNSNPTSRAMAHSQKLNFFTIYTIYPLYLFDVSNGILETNYMIIIQDMILHPTIEHNSFFERTRQLASLNSFLLCLLLWDNHLMNSLLVYKDSSSIILSIALHGPHIIKLYVENPQTAHHHQILAKFF